MDDDGSFDDRWFERTVRFKSFYDIFSSNAANTKVPLLIIINLQSQYHNCPWYHHSLVCHLNSPPSNPRIIQLFDKNHNYPLILSIKKKLEHSIFLFISPAHRMKKMNMLQNAKKTGFLWFSPIKQAHIHQKQKIKHCKIRMINDGDKTNRSSLAFVVEL